MITHACSKACTLHCVNMFNTCLCGIVCAPSPPCCNCTSICSAYSVPFWCCAALSNLTPFDRSHYPNTGWRPLHLVACSCPTDTVSVLRLSFKVGILVLIFSHVHENLEFNSPTPPPFCPITPTLSSWSRPALDLEDSFVWRICFAALL